MGEPLSHKETTRRAFTSTTPPIQTRYPAAIRSEVLLPARNVISDNSCPGVVFAGAGVTGNLLEGNRIGTNAAGTAALGNAADGVLIENGASANTVGGSASGAGNIISGNTNDGVEITGAGTTGNVVAGNDIGTDYTGTQAIPNYAGVEIDSGATGNLIGTNGDGVERCARAEHLERQPFRWCLDDRHGDGKQRRRRQLHRHDRRRVEALGNGSQTVTDALGSEIGGGVVIENGASDNLVGTSGQSADDAGERNIISGNTKNDGVDIYGSGTSGNVVAGNFIGTNATGTAALGNGGDGVFVTEVSSANWIGVNPVYGPENADEGNVLSGNAYYGVEVFDSTQSVDRRQPDRDGCHRFDGDPKFFVRYLPRGFFKQPGRNLGTGRGGRCSRAQRDLRELECGCCILRVCRR